ASAAGPRDPRHASRLHRAPSARGVVAHVPARVPHDGSPDPPPRVRRTRALLPLACRRPLALRRLQVCLRSEPRPVRGRDARVLRTGTALNRRHAWLPALLLVLWGGAAWAASPILLMSTEVRPTAAILWARAAQAGPVTVELTPSGGAPRTIGRQASAPDDLRVRVDLEGLTPATRHRYAVRQGGEHAEGEFTTAPASADATTVTFLWSGDLGGGGFCRLLDGGYRIFRAMARHAADFFLFAG